MPDLKKEDVAQFDLARVEKELDDRISEVERITDGVESWDQIPEDREGRDRLPKMMAEMNLLGKRRDEISVARDEQASFDLIRKVLKDPVRTLELNPNPKPTRAKDFAGQFMDSRMRSAIKDGNRNVGAEFPLEAFGVKATLGEDATQTNIDTDYPIRTDRVPGIVDELFQTPNIADLIPSITTSADSIEYVGEDWTDAAAETNEGDAISESTSDWTLTSEPVRLIGAAVSASMQVLDDEGLLRGLVQLRLTQDLRRREDLQILKGSGVAPNLDGIIGRSGVNNQNYSLAAGTDDFIEAIFKAMTDVRQAFQTPTAAVMNALSWETIRLIRDASGGAGTGGYLFGPPSLAVPERVWGLRVVLNENMDDPGTATNVPVLLGDWANSAMIARNGSVSTAVSDSHASRFLQNILTFKATMREALIVHRASGFATVTVTA